MYSTPAERPRLVPLLLIGTGLLALVAGILVGGEAAAAGAVAFLCACGLALVETTRSIVTWPNAILVFVAVIWFVPIKLYSLPVDLPFELELYRFLMLVMALAFVVSAIQTRRDIDSVGAGKPLYVLALAALTSQAMHTKGLAASGSQDQALKSLSFFLSFIVIFLLVASTIDNVRDVDRILAGVVVGGAIISITALYEARAHYNLFNHLDAWLPFSRNEREILELRAGRLRAHSSAQHPIALGAALIMVVPLATYLAQRAARGPKAIFWSAAAATLLVGALVTISRTAVVMGIAMLVVGLWLRPRVLPRVVPVLLVMPIVAHVAAPGALGGLAHSFGIGGGRPLIESVQGRPGQSGSGRLDDIEPGLTMWSRSPLVGLGLTSKEVGTVGATDTQTAGQTSGVAIIFDNQYLRTLVALGIVGLAGAIWFVWGSAIRLAKSSKHLEGDDGDLLAACGVACAGYAAGMAFFDSFSFVQVTLLFFIIAALGLKALTLVRANTAPGTATLL